MSVMIDLMEAGLLPDALIRRGIRRLLQLRLRDESHGDTEVERQRQREFFALLRNSPLAVETRTANDQHSELPPAFFSQVLGPRLKYSSCLYPIGVTNIADAEEAMLVETCRRTGLVNGMDILELGCGWGSLTLWMAEQYPNVRITAVSNSARQREFIESVCHDKGFDGDEDELWFQRCRVFFMACAEMFGYNSGNEWFVGHYMFRKVSCRPE